MFSKTTGPVLKHFHINVSLGELYGIPLSYARNAASINRHMKGYENVDLLTIMDRIRFYDDQMTSVSHTLSVLYCI